jgi:hypothetical protein
MIGAFNPLQRQFRLRVSEYFVPKPAMSKTSFCAAIKSAREQKSVSLEKRAEATYAEYRRQKASGAGGRGFQLPLC